MLKTKLFTAIALVAALLLLAPAAYADTGTTTGSFGAASQPPTVNDIGIYDEIGCTTPTLAMDPQTEYYCKVTVTSNNKLKHLSTVKVTIFYDGTGGDPVAPTIPDTQTCAILTCTVDPAIRPVPPLWVRSLTTTVNPLIAFCEPTTTFPEPAPFRVVTIRIALTGSFGVP